MKNNKNAIQKKKIKISASILLGRLLAGALSLAAVLIGTSQQAKVFFRKTFTLPNVLNKSVSSFLDYKAAYASYPKSYIVKILKGTFCGNLQLFILQNRLWIGILIATMWTISLFSVGISVASLIERKQMNNQILLGIILSHVVMIFEPMIRFSFFYAPIGYMFAIFIPFTQLINYYNTRAINIDAKRAFRIITIWSSIACINVLLSYFKITTITSTFSKLGIIKL